MSSSSLSSLALAPVPPSEGGQKILQGYLDKGGEPRAFTIYVIDDDHYSLPNVGIARKFVETYWIFFDRTLLEPGKSYSFIAIDANNGKSNARYPICCVDVCDGQDDGVKMSHLNYHREKDGRLLSYWTDFFASTPSSTETTEIVSRSELAPVLRVLKTLRTEVFGEHGPDGKMIWFKKPRIVLTTIEETAE